MSTKQAKEKAFDRASMEQWRTAAEQSMRGKPLESLQTASYEGISLQPLYVREDLDGIEMDMVPGAGNYVRGFHSRPKWHIAQKLEITDWQPLLEEVTKAAHRGQEAISINIDRLNDIEHLQFEELFNIADLPISIMTKRHFTNAAAILLNSEPRYLPKGIMATDVLSCRLENGELMKMESKAAENWKNSVIRLDEQYKELKTILVDVAPFHSSGANAVQELATAIAGAVFYIEYFRQHGWEASRTTGKMAFHFAVGSSFFMEIAKLRAFRKLMATVLDAYGVKEGEGLPLVSAETSPYTKASLDPYVNLLRAGNEAFAAVMGGIDFLHVSPFDENVSMPAEAASRLAANTQLILREEALLDRVADPAGGSYYVETLTAEMADKAWALFQEIDRRGGMAEVIKSGWIQASVADVEKHRRQDLETRRKTMIGVNVYAKLDDKPGTRAMEAAAQLGAEGYEDVTALRRTRVSEGFERLRMRAFSLAEKGRQPVAGLLCLGSLKEHKPRADFVSGVLAAGGIQTEWSHECQSLAAVKAFISQSDCRYICICGTDEKYAQLAGEIGKWFQDSRPGIHVDIAGQFDADKLSDLKICGTIHAGQNIYKKLDSLLGLWEGEKHVQ
ncbi:MAG TPA: methylmalonyl-CoA mutase family protein [Bacillaceae bacterium]